MYHVMMDLTFMTHALSCSLVSHGRKKVHFQPSASYTENTIEFYAKGVREF